MARSQKRAEVVYGVTSLSATNAGPVRLLEIVRAHWGQENGMHYRRDVTLKEDAGHTRDWTVAHALAILNNLIFPAAARGQDQCGTNRRYYAAHPDQALRLFLMMTPA